MLLVAFWHFQMTRAACAAQIHMDDTCAAQVAAALCASYVGGSVNFAAVSVALGLPQGTTLAAAMAADVLVMAVRVLLTVMHCR